MSYHLLYAVRSKISVVGLKTKATQDIKQKTNKSAAFWILHLWAKRKDTALDFSWSYRTDESSHFGTIARMFEVQRIQIEGTNC